MALEKVNGLTQKQERAIVALLSEASVLKAAETVKVGLRTMHRWLDEPAFARAYMRARRQSFQQAISLTMRYAPMAVQALARVMADVNAPAAAKVAAASAILKFSRESIELDDLAQRIAALERPDAASQPGKAA